ncbi:MAG: hypothetical protein ACLTYN_02305 [Dysosmobacter welbionis]
MRSISPTGTPPKQDPGLSVRAAADPGRRHPPPGRRPHRTHPGRLPPGLSEGAPADAPPDPEEDLPFQLWAEYLENSDPDRRLAPRQISMIRYREPRPRRTLLMNCSDADAPALPGSCSAATAARNWWTPMRCPAGHGAEPAAGPGIRRGSARADRLFRLVAGTGRPAPEGRRPAAVPPPDGPGPRPGRRGHPAA